MRRPQRAGLRLPFPVLALILVLGTLTATGTAAADPWASLPQRLTVDQGGLLVLVLPEPAQDLQARAFDRTWPIHPHGEKSVLLVPASYHLAPGTYHLTLPVPGHEQTLEVDVRARDFPVQALVVPPSTEQLTRPADTANQERQARESQEVVAARRHSSPTPLWDGPFLWPVEGRITSEFGLIRLVNGVPNGRHSGLDIAAPTGTPVRAAGSGVVALAAHHLTGGKTIIIDHGWNLTTSYLHLSEIHVAPGERVTKGQVIGLVGSTGFATGPHLHWTANVNGVFIDPRLLISDLLDL